MEFGRRTRRSISAGRSPAPGLRRSGRAGNDARISTIHANDIDIHYERSGAGPRTLFLNGSGSTLATSALLIAPFAERLEVVAHDQRGLGLTDIPPGPYAMADYAADALALLDGLGWERCRVVGVSFGGMVAQELAVTAPERVQRLALCCTSPGGRGGASYPLQELAALPAAERAAVGTKLLDTRFDPDWLASHPADRGLAETQRNGQDRGAVARRDRTARGARPPRRVRAAAPDRVPDAGRGRPVRRHRAAREQ
jgi:pimeloyl-ACP methyl ester carboxylesterase